MHRRRRWPTRCGPRAAATSIHVPDQNATWECAKTSRSLEDEP